MNFEFFDSLSQAEATEFLNNFLNTESKAVEVMLNEAKSEGVVTDFTVTSVPGVLKWLVGKLSTISRAPDETVPLWIRATESYSSSLFDFDESSTVAILRGGYYLGQSFVNHSALLSWGIGDSSIVEGTKSAKQNMPVVKGFNLNLELAPIMVVENLSRRIKRHAAGNEAIDQAIRYWLDKVPEPIH